MLSIQKNRFIETVLWENPKHLCLDWWIRNAGLKVSVCNQNLVFLFLNQTIGSAVAQW